MASRIALITGCSSGIGMETALRLARRSQDPITVYATMRNMTSKNDIEHRAGESLEKSLFVRRLDVTKEDTIVDVVSHIKSKHGRLDILGIYYLKNIYNAVRQYKEYIRRFKKNGYISYFLNPI